jgi:hypothetical protein
MAAEDEVDVPALVEIVKEQWRAANLRAEQLQAEVDRMKPVVDAARGFVAKRNELHGDPSNPDWWQGQDWGLARATFEYEERLTREGRPSADTD